jgi:hypothetical protein
MARQSLKRRKVAIILQEFGDRKVPVNEIRIRLKEEGLIDCGPEAILEWELELTRKAIQEARQFDNTEGTGKVEMINLFETLEDGTRSEYYRNVHKCTILEAVQHLDYWNRQGRIADRKFHYYLNEFSKIHDRQEIQRRLPFDIPADPDAEQQGDDDGRTGTDG